MVGSKMMATGQTTQQDTGGRGANTWVTGNSTVTPYQAKNDARHTGQCFDTAGGSKHMNLLFFAYSLR